MRFAIFRRPIFFACLVLSSCFAVAAAHAQRVPPDLEATIHLKVLSYDRGLKDRSGGRLTIAVVYAKGVAESEKGRDDMVKAFQTLAKKVTIRGITPSVVAVAFEGSDPARPLTAAGATVVYLAPSLDDKLPALQAAAGKLRVPILCSQRPLVERGAAVGVVASAGKPAIVVNLRAAKAIGLDLDPNLLRLAEVIK